MFDKLLADDLSSVDDEDEVGEVGEEVELLSKLIFSNPSLTIPENSRQEGDQFFITHQIAPAYASKYEIF